MAEEIVSAIGEAAAETTKSSAEDSPPPTVEVDSVQPEAADEQHESRTRGMLRDAIQKVMTEIDYHEKESQKHLQLAAALRKDLRDSFSFLRDQEGRGKAADSAGDRFARMTAETKTDAKAENVAAAGRRQPPAAKKKPTAAKGKKG